MEREEIVRDDFPTARKGWDPQAVRSHLEALADHLPTASTSLADTAAERVSEIVAAAEATAAELEAEARREAEATRADAHSALERARREAEELVVEAREEARRRIEQAQAAVDGLVGQAEELRSRVGSLGDAVAGEVQERLGEPGPEAVVRPSPEPSRPPTPALEPEPVATDPGGPVAEAPASGDVADDSSTEDLIAELKRGNGGPADEPGPPADGGDAGAARLVAMNMALDGAEREQIAARLSADFAALDGAEALVDEVLERAGRG